MKNKNLKVLHIITRFIPGGADENTLFTIKGLQKHNCKVDLLVGGESDFSYLNNIKNINLIITKELKRNIEPFNDLLAFFKIFRIIKTNHYDIVHTHTAKAGILGRLAAKLAKTPIVIHTLHGVTFHDFLHPLTKNFYVLLEKLAGCFTDVFITVGEDLKRKYIAKNIAKSNKFITIRSGIELGKFVHYSQLPEEYRLKEREKLGISQSDVVIGTASRLEPRKGHLYLLKAAGEIVKKFPNTRFLILGDGYYKEKLEQEVKNLNLTNNVMFLGFRWDIYKIFPLFDIFVLTSLWEGLPRVLVQAAAAGKPIVTFNVEGAWEIVKEGINGFIVPPKDVKALTERLSFLIGNLSQAKYMGIRGKEFVTDSWDKDVMVEKILALYEDLINVKRPYFIN